MPCCAYNQLGLVAAFLSTDGSGFLFTGHKADVHRQGQETQKEGKGDAKGKGKREGHRAGRRVARAHGAQLKRAAAALAVVEEVALFIVPHGGGFLLSLPLSLGDDDDDDDSPFGVRPFYFVVPSTCYLATLCPSLH